MYSGNQTTILSKVSFFGKPKNMERVVNVTLLPAEANSGIVFKRTDLKENNLIKMSYENVKVENDKLILKNSFGNSINNFELFLAAIWCSKIDNMLIEIDGDSIPYMDGTTEPILFALSVGKIKEFEITRKIFTINDDIGIKVGSSEISVKPSTIFKININISNSEFQFDNSELPFKDSLSRINENDQEKVKYFTILIISMIFLSGLYCNFEASFVGFDKKMIVEFFSNLFNKRIG